MFTSGTLRPDDIVFLSAAAFVAGAACGGAGIPPLYAAPVALGILLSMMSSPKRLMAVLIASVFLLGNAYYAYDDYRYRAAQRVVLQQDSFIGTVSRMPRAGLDYQTITVRLADHDARILVRADQHARIAYGDMLEIRGTVVPPPKDAYGRYLAKERLHGTIFYPEFTITGNAGNPVFNALFSTHLRIEHMLARYFTHQHAAFLSGILLGERSGFNRAFLDKLSVSGTMHLTALSGLHMAILVFLAFAVFKTILPGRRTPFVATFALIALFVAMTGFKVSAVRASLMAFLVGLARESNRTYSPRNALACAACIITAANPKMPIFDIGFQLSFAATASIVYFTPVLDRFAFFATSGFISWRDVLKITLAAQLGVAPLTIMYFENFSLTALAANVALLVVMPVMMALGLATVCAGIFLPPLAEILKWPTAFLIEYAIGVIETFAAVRIPFNPDVGILAVVLYYAGMVWLCYRYARRTSNRRTPA